MDLYAKCTVDMEMLGTLEAAQLASAVSNVHMRWYMYKHMTYWDLAIIDNCTKGKKVVC